MSITSIVSADRERMHLGGKHFAPPTPLLRPLSSGGCQLPPIRSSLRTPPPMSPPNAITLYPTSTETQVPHMNSRREAHILAEQKRRGNINSGFDELKSVVPTCANTADSKAKILKKAADHIRMLQTELELFRNGPNPNNQFEYHQMRQPAPVRPIYMHTNIPSVFPMTGPGIPTHQPVHGHLHMSAPPTVPMFSPSTPPIWPPKLLSHISDDDMDIAIGPRYPFGVGRAPLAEPHPWPAPMQLSNRMVRPSGSMRDHGRR